MIEAIVIILMAVGFLTWLVGISRLRESGAVLSYLGAASLFTISGLSSILAGNMSGSALRILGFEGPFPGMLLFFVGLAGVALSIIAFLVTFSSARAIRRSSID